MILTNVTAFLYFFFFLFLTCLHQLDCTELVKEVASEVSRDKEQRQNDQVIPLSITPACVYQMKEHSNLYACRFYIQTFHVLQ